MSEFKGETMSIEVSLAADVQSLKRLLAVETAEKHRLEHKIRRLTGELAAERQKSSALERKHAGVDEDEFDPTKQKGIGAIPIGGDFREVEALERLLGMAPTLDEQLRALGMKTPEEQIRQLGMEKEHEETLAIARIAAPMDEIVVPRLTFMRLVQLLWAAREAGLRPGLGEAEARLHHVSCRIDELPRVWFIMSLELDEWDVAEEPLPPLRAP